MVTRRKTPAVLLSAKEQAFVVALLGGADVLTAAKEIGVSGRTGHTWLQKPAVRDAIHEGRRQVIDAATTKLAALSSKAHAVLAAAMDLATPGVPWGVRTGAAKMVHELMNQGLASADLSARLARFERLAAGKAADGHHDAEESDPGATSEPAAETLQ